MIVLNLPSLRKLPYKTPVIPIVQEIVLEAIRRDLIVKKLFENCPYNAGDTVTCHDKDSEDTYGDDIYVESICSTYGHLGPTTEWPETDVPMIVMAWSNKTNSRFTCTPGFLKVKK